MPNYQDFVKKAKERFEERQKVKASNKGQYQFTLHAQFKMKQYGLSDQKVKGVIRNPKRREVGIVPRTVAVMQPVSIKKIDGKPGRPGGEMWKQEIWVMFVVKNQKQEEETQNSRFRIQDSAQQKLRIISAWRYPGVSPKRNPIPEEILRELEEGSILEAVDDI
ncbi:MAG: hypothetical protein WCG73_01715 [Candidatus Moraniibacteriota bacterium]